MSEKYCPKCKNAVGIDDIRCPNCNMRLKMICPSCNMTNRFGSEFCSSCGEQLLKYCENCGSANLPDFSECRKCHSVFSDNEIVFEKKRNAKKSEIIDNISTDETLFVQNEPSMTEVVVENEIDFQQMPQDNNVDNQLNDRIVIENKTNNQSVSDNKEDTPRNDDDNSKINDSVIQESNNEDPVDFIENALPSEPLVLQNTDYE